MLTGKAPTVVANPRSPLDLRRRFSTMEECRDFLFGLRFPDGWLCSCGGQTFWWRSGTKIRCRTCSRDRSVLAGTIFQKTRTPLPVWFKAAWGIATASGGISALQLQRVLLKRPVPLVRTFANNLMAYAIGRRIEYYDNPAIRRIEVAARANNYRINDFILGVVKSDAFRMRRLPVAQLTPGSTGAASGRGQ
jgi:hypothetical protein